ncbi:cupin domain-containing protein [Psychrobium sp. 1_MG-2023]|uniref:ribosomal protein uL16 3-hydroxylase n=1 Tax=Psychrobium sp. 1_MG-2023 TaxID=3062624 RepID=UPI000C327C28|nr:cupin domain-containing protein [Psychrobium sp. 1_MG-2023]MDP2561882.1 cupin domain-containing protein [Psychrobium sp. 1_MG-2023]PKF59702.1 cupin domain-containing protein [Alteromonadales bacterium alter-6D02]
MYSINLNDLTPQHFLDEYWQKKPLLIRQGLSDFDDPISPDEFAGLAMEEQIESRLVWQEDGEWQAEHGPFEDYSHLGDKDWSLLIQGVDHWDEQVAELIRPFRFLPNWRIDDVMVSFATPGGGVGPHVDNYDVFIIQGSGKRHWQVGSNTELKEVVAHSALLHVERFSPIIDAELLPGDILYIPPGFPHQGVAVEPSMSYSVGFRTTAKANLFSHFADYLIDNQQGKEMVVDPERQITTTPGLIADCDVNKLTSALHEMLEDKDQLTDFFGQHLSQAKHDLAIDPEQETISLEEFNEILNQQDVLIRLGGLRCLYFDSDVAIGSIYINGEKFTLQRELHSALTLLADNTELSYEQLAPWLHEQSFCQLLVDLINAGYWYFQE